MVKINPDSNLNGPLESLIPDDRPSGEALAEVLVGFKLNMLRNERGLSLRALASLSGLNINTFSHTRLENLGKDLAGSAVQPFVVTLAPGAGSGERMIVHTGHEFVYCLSGRVIYTIDDKTYPLESGDSVVFESHLPHCWKNHSDGEAQIILIMYPADEHEAPGGRHFSI